MDCSLKNFPYKSFYNDENEEVYLFYRQGQAFVIDPENPLNYRFEQMTDMDLGQMFLLYNKALIARSSSKILFFKIVKDEDTEQKKWTLYHTLQSRGFIYYIKGNIRIQVTTDDQICFYLIDKDTLIPKLENVMFNFMNCT